MVTRFWQFCFFILVGAYCLYYAPYGVNETDGGFLTGLAWQVLNGKLLYQDVIYVRPPLPVWLRALELQMLPENLAILGERWIFYLKVALYSWLGAAVVAKGNRRWQLATLGFVVSAHCYPPMAWHTVDGILFGVMAAYFASRPSKYQWFVSGVCLSLALLCKQSFYPLLPAFLFLFYAEKTWYGETIKWFLGGVSLVGACFFLYLQQHDILRQFLQMTNGAAAGGEAFQHGVVDYFRITPELSIPTLLVFIPSVWLFWKNRKPQAIWFIWIGWLLALVLSYAAVTWMRQEHTAPFAQSRALFWVSVLWVLKYGIGIGDVASGRNQAAYRIPPAAFQLLAISWCASVSWGYNLPMLFSTPWIWAAMEVTQKWWGAASKEKEYTAYSFAGLIAKWGGIGLLVLLLLAFRLGHEFVYRDGRRSQMTEPMGAIFPKMSGIYSDMETAYLYRDLKELAGRYAPNFKTMPAFPQANFLTDSPPPLPLDWVVNRETNGKNDLVFHSIDYNRPVYFVQKTFQDKFGKDPELSVTQEIFKCGQILEETPHFWIIRFER